MQNRQQSIACGSRAAGDCHTYGRSMPIGCLSSLYQIGKLD